MSIDSVVSIANQYNIRDLSAVVQVAAAKRGLDQQELRGQAALKLLESAAIPIDPNMGQNIDIYA
ncbi:Putative motility protein [Malonomonas rubra DSM 5091]|uniref:Putative motility protein n=1 Tax=Malonomonas rubra DSM 5091 TaxID=1122189 RepID=A0A1M6C3B1_MALRU|nr:putative motility protein [Malonomonas rubra]SHI55442.1 Putative motility protein [Malonomonas rubra DSM 5091]